MLIEFSVSNFRSFRERQTFSMVAAPRLRKKENAFKPDIDGEKFPDLLKVAAIYGPNASGKSNLIEAFKIMREFADLKPAASPPPLPVNPFRFDRLLENEPSRFEVHFVQARRRFAFELAATAERIVEEKLVAYPKGKESLLYSRKWTGTVDEYAFGSSLEGSVDLHETWRRLTGPRVLFLTQAVANSNEDLMQLKVPRSWMADSFAGISNDMSGWADVSQVLAKKIPLISDEISAFLRQVDVPVTSMRFDPDESADASPERHRATFLHRTDLGEAEFSFEEESNGTRNLIGFWLPWYKLKMKQPGNGVSIFAVDELDSSLHPRIVENLVAAQLKSTSNTQLIFTTHDTHLMDAKLLRRDQFWLTERDGNGATQLRSIHEFEGRESEDIEKRYYAGRYRALPLVLED